MAERRSVEVWAAWDDLGAPRRLGTLHATSGRGVDVFAFEFEPAWLLDGPAVLLDPGLQRTRGSQYVAAGRESFGMLLDSAPDRWGRVLMQRREAQRARAGRRAERQLTSLDYLLGVFDGHRLGGLRFRVGDGPFLDDDAELASPPWTSLRALEDASRRLEADGADADPRAAAWLRLLIAPGRSLGGARPKASVRDVAGALSIAKFPSRDDAVDVGAWELVVHRLAARAGISTAEAQARRFSSRHHTFLTRRFNRTVTGARRHFASAMTLLERSDGDDAQAGASYLELAEVIRRVGAAPARDLEQLWRRVAFFVCVSNVDDHLRNHGFLLGARGWSLAPAYDVNPVAHGGGLSLNITETDNTQDLELVRAVAPQFRVTATRARTILGEVTAAVQTWPREATALRLSRTAQAAMAPAFAAAEAVAPTRSHATARVSTSSSPRRARR